MKKSVGLIHAVWINIRNDVLGRGKISQVNSRDRQVHSHHCENWHILPGQDDDHLNFGIKSTYLRLE